MDGAQCQAWERLSAEDGFVLGTEKMQTSNGEDSVTREGT